MEDRLKEMVENYKKLENTRDELLMELKRISQDTIERVERIKNSTKAFDADQHLKQARKEIKKTIFPNIEVSNISVPPPVEQPTPPPAPVAKETKIEQPVLVDTNTGKTIKSFFDEIG
jgi:cell division initiation protein